MYRIVIHDESEEKENYLLSPSKYKYLGSNLIYSILGRRQGINANK
jgi:hypothetical protein